jgi:cellulose synthase/poly-beta-1,6-N-acetylglucosamine synthase-like glycosyltransferase
MFIRKILLATGLAAAEAFVAPTNIGGTRQAKSGEDREVTCSTVNETWMIYYIRNKKKKESQGNKCHDRTMMHCEDE